MSNQKNSAVRRIMAELRELSNPTSLYHAVPHEHDIFEIHWTIRGPPEGGFKGGIYHGRMLLPPEYPFKPPSVIFLTPNGRFKCGEKICLSISAHHPETWNPSWSIRTALVALIGFMPTPGNGAIGALDYTEKERAILAKKSVSWQCPMCKVVCCEALLSADDNASVEEQLESLSAAEREGLQKMAIGVKKLAQAKADDSDDEESDTKGKEPKKMESNNSNKNNGNSTNSSDIHDVGTSAGASISSQATSISSPLSSQPGASTSPQQSKQTTSAPSRSEPWKQEDGLRNRNHSSGIYSRPEATHLAGPRTAPDESNGIIKNADSGSEKERPANAVPQRQTHNNNNGNTRGIPDTNKSFSRGDRSSSRSDTATRQRSGRRRGKGSIEDQILTMAIMICSLFIVYYVGCVLTGKCVPLI